LSAGLQVREVLSLLACGDQWVNFALHALIWARIVSKRSRDRGSWQKHLLYGAPLFSQIHSLPPSCCT
jgi:hypothetical protein